MNIKYGSPPNVDRLGSLKPGTSSTADVIQVLGEPRGYGATRLTPDLPFRDIWFYEYVVSDGRRVDLKFLLVFVDEDLYDGHFWFSSTQLMEVTK